LTEEEKVLIKLFYGRDVSIEDIISTAKRFMMAERQVVIVKEDLDNRQIKSYAENPMTTTVLVFCYKYKTLDKRKK
jgi:DNA polymerase-3 subunit delta